MAEKPTRRTFLTAAGTSGALALAGCMGDTGGDETEKSGKQDDSNSDSKSDSQSSGASKLKADGSSTVYPITSDAGAVWNSNPPADDKEYWGPSEYDIDTDERLADYWGGIYGFESSGDAAPPFDVSVGLSHSGTGVEKVKNGVVDIGDSSAPVAAEFPDASEEELESYTDHVVGVDAQPIVVSTEIKEAGVTKLTAEQVRKIYRGEIENWTDIPAYDGEDKEIQAVGRAEGSGTDTAFRANMLGGPDAKMSGVDVRKGQNQQVKTVISKSNNAIAYMALAFVSSDVPAIKLEFDGKVYEPGKNLADENYPLSRDLHCYTWEGTSKKEAAFLRFIISEFGQDNYVETNNYATLTPERRENQLSKLPEPEN